MVCYYKYIYDILQYMMYTFLENIQRGAYLHIIISSWSYDHSKCQKSGAFYKKLQNYMKIYTLFSS